MPLFSFVIIAALASILLILAFKNLAVRAGYVDDPDQDKDARKRHKHAVPPIGGIIVVPVGMLVSMFAGFDWLSFWPVTLSVLMLLIVGLLDDKYDIPAFFKFAVQISVAILLVVPGQAELSYMGNLFGWGDIHLGMYSPIFSVICVVLFLNAINMIDGLDGLLCSILTIMLCALASLSLFSGQGELNPLILSFIGALIGFAVFNMRFPWQKNALIFMGDAGTLALGALVGWAAIYTYNISYINVNDVPLTASIPAMVLGWLLAYPVMDTFALFAYRLKNKRSPFSPDRYHLHHILRDSGLSVSLSVLILCMLQLTYTLLAILCLLKAQDIPQYVFFYPWVVILAVHTSIVFNARKVEAFLLKLNGPGKMMDTNGS